MSHGLKHRLLAVSLCLIGAAMVHGPLAAADPEAKQTSRSPVTISPGERAKVSLFGVQAEGSKFVYVLDRSGSMGDGSGKALATAKAELLASLDKLDTVHQFQIIFYNERPRVFNPTGEPGRLAFGTDQNRAEVKRFIDTIKPDGGTAHEDALVMAIRMHPDVIFLLTDADDPKLTSRQLARLERLGPGIIIHTIEFGTGRQRDPENFLVRLARQSGGEHVYVDVAKLEDAKE